MSGWIIDTNPRYTFLRSNPDLIAKLKMLRREFARDHKGESMTISLFGSQAALFFVRDPEGPITNYLKNTDGDISVVVSPGVFNNPEIMGKLRQLIFSIFGFQDGEYEEINKKNANDEPYRQIKGTGSVKIDITVSMARHLAPFHNYDYRICINDAGHLETHIPDFMGAAPARRARQFLLNSEVFQSYWQPSMEKGAAVNYEVLFRTPHLNPYTAPASIFRTLSCMIRTAAKTLYFGVYPHPYTLFFFAGLHNTPLQAFDGRERKDALSQSTWYSLLDCMNKTYFVGQNAVFSGASTVLTGMVAQEIGVAPMIAMGKALAPTPASRTSSDGSDSGNGSSDNSFDTSLDGELGKLSLGPPLPTSTACEAHPK